MYFIAENGGIVFDNNGQLFFIPVAQGNMDYQKYLLWVAEGNTAEAWVVPESFGASPDAN